MLQDQTPVAVCAAGPGCDARMEGRPVADRLRGRRNLSLACGALGVSLTLALVSVCVAAGGGHRDLACADCHMPAGGSGMAVGGMGSGEWSTRHTADGVPTFKLYSSPSFDALGTDIGQPDGASKVCLGCHDGSYPGVRNKGATFMFNDLSRTHPISFTYNSALVSRVRRGTLNDPRSTSSGLGGTIASDLLDERGKMQCTSCHDVHAKSPGKKMLRYDYNPNTRQGSEMCNVCHNL